MEVNDFVIQRAVSLSISPVNRYQTGGFCQGFTQTINTHSLISVVVIIDKPKNRVIETTAISNRILNGEVFLNVLNESLFIGS